MTPEAIRILTVFRARNLRTGGIIHFTDFGKAIVWKDGFVRDEPVRQAFNSLVEQGYVTELKAGLELTAAGEKYLYSDEIPKYGARVYRVGERVLIKQTVLRGTPQEYVIDEHKERHLRPDDDAGIAAAIRDALDGRL